MNKIGIHMVVGGAGMIGGALFYFLRRSSEKVVATGLWKNKLGKEKIYLNLASASSEWMIPDCIKTVYICAGITKLNECQKDPIGSSRVNVDGITRFSEFMLKRGAFIVFLSSNQVFDGNIANVPAHIPQNPQSEYGHQKATVEKFLNQWPEKTAIVRMTKVVGPDSIFSRWSQSLCNGHFIYPFVDMVVSPIPLVTVVSILRLIGDQQLAGIWQISGKSDLAYSDLAYLIAKDLSINTNLIKPRTMAEAGLEGNINVANTTMSIKRLMQDLGIVPPNINFLRAYNGNLYYTEK